MEEHLEGNAAEAEEEAAMEPAAEGVVVQQEVEAEAAPEQEEEIAGVEQGGSEGSAFSSPTLVSCSDLST